jgi:hypothetical protein
MTGHAFQYAPYEVMVFILGAAAWTTDEGQTWHEIPGVSGNWGVGFANPQAEWFVGTTYRYLKISFWKWSQAGGHPSIEPSRSQNPHPQRISLHLGLVKESGTRQIVAGVLINGFGGRVEWC